MSLNLCKKTLTEKVLDFQQTGEGFDSVVQDVCLKIYTYPKKKLNLTEDDCGNFYEFIHPQLKRVATLYKKKGSFEAYFNSILYWNLKTYVKKKIINFYTWKTAASEALWVPIDECESVKGIIKKIRDDDRLRDIFMMKKSGKIYNEAGKKMLLIFMLKKTKDLDIEDILYLSEITGYDPHWLMEIVESLRSSLDHKLLRLKKFRERRNMAFWRLTFLEQRLKNAGNEIVQGQMKRKIKRLKSTIRDAIDAISRIRLSPTHKMIAAALGISKGTVDSTLVRLRKKLTMVRGHEEKQYA